MLEASRKLLDGIERTHLRLLGVHKVTKTSTFSESFRNLVSHF